MGVKPGYKQTEVGIIPEEWAIEPLGKYVRITSGESPALFHFTNSGLPYFKVEQLSNSEKFLHRSSTPYYFEKGKTVPCGSVVFAKRGAAIALNKVRILAQESFMDTNLMALTPAEGLDGEFLFYALGYIGLWRFADTTSVPQINNKHVKPLALPFPNRDEQRAIAEALSDVDALLGGLDRLIAKKRDLKQTAMQQLLTGQTRLPGFHGEWEVKTLGQLGKISGAGVDKKIRPDELPVRLVNYMDVYRRTFIYSKDLNHVVSASPEQAARCAVRRGDVFFTPSSEMPFDVAVSAVAMEDIQDAAYSYHVVRLRLDEDWDLLFRAYAFKSREFVNQASRASEGSGVRYVITQGRFRQLSVRYPPTKAEQTAIAEVLTEMDAELAALEQRREKTRALKQAMMQELLSGKTRLV